MCLAALRHLVVCLATLRLLVAGLAALRLLVVRLAALGLPPTLRLPLIHHRLQQLLPTI